MTERFAPAEIRTGTYRDALRISRAKNDMRRRLAAVYGDGAPPMFVEEAETLHPTGPGGR